MDKHQLFFVLKKWTKNEPKIIFKKPKGRHKNGQNGQNTTNWTIWTIMDKK
jgi:hypothetical protein